MQRIEKQSISQLAHSCARIPSYARLATKGSGEMQIVKASDLLQKLV